MKRDLLKEAIADAKTVKETAIANAKLALEEAFTPYLKEKLATKLAEMDEEDLDENKNVNSVNETESPTQEELELDEMDLDEILREVEEMDEEKEEMMEGEDDLINDPKDSTAHGNVEEEVEEEEEDEEIDLENMTEEDLKTFIESVISDMVAAGELEAGHEGMEDEEGYGIEPDEEIEDEEEINIDELVSELKKGKKYGGNKGDIPASKRGKIKKDTAEDEGIEDYKKKLKETQYQLNEAYKVIHTIKTDLNEVNLLNAKLLYTNKVFRAKNLTENQKVKVLDTFDKATTVKETKLIYETLMSEIKNKKPSINESLIVGSASKSTGVAPTKTPIFEVNDQFARWQKLAGIKK